jgi:hypothetical protein
MPAIHGSLTDQEFDDFGAIAKSKGMSRNELCTALATAEIHNLANVGNSGGVIEA